MIPKPPFPFPWLTEFQFTRWIFLNVDPPPMRKSLCIFSNMFLTFLGILKSDSKHIGILDSVLLISVSLPPFEIYCLFQAASLLPNFSSIPSHTLDEFNLEPSGCPR